MRGFFDDFSIAGIDANGGLRMVRICAVTLFIQLHVEKNSLPTNADDILLEIGFIIVIINIMDAAVNLINFPADIMFGGICRYTVVLDIIYSVGPQPTQNS